jgi:hypothetical protein
MNRNNNPKIIIGLIILLLLLSFPVNFSLAQDNITIIDQSSDAEFRDHITFRLEAESTAEIVEVNLFYQIVGQIASSRNAAEFTPGTSITAEFEIDQSDPSNYSPPGTEMYYWWKITDTAGNELRTEKETLLYLDNRYEWQTLENERLTLYWYEGDDSFGQALFERANLALDTLETDVGIALERPIKIFIYGNHEDLLGALRASAQEWTGGVAFAEFGVVLIGIHPRQLEWGLNAMTHEMSHLVIHQATDNPFGDLPRWLDEGIAVYNENRDELDDDFRSIFDQAVQRDKLMTLRTLSSPFPADPLQANLAYGQSGAVVKYTIDTYGSDAMAELLSIFAEGALYDEALEQALGVDTDGLDNEFRLSLGLPPLPGTEVAVQEESAAAEVEIVEAEPESSESVAATDETTNVAEEPTTSSAAEEPVSEEPTNAAETETQSSPLGGLPCLAGLIPLILIGFVVMKKPSWG